MAIGILNSNRSRRFQNDKGGLVIKSPFITFVSAQKLNVIPVVAALIVAPPIVSLPASREQT